MMAAGCFFFFSFFSSLSLGGRRIIITRPIMMKVSGFQRYRAGRELDVPDKKRNWGAIAIAPAYDVNSFSEYKVKSFLFRHQRPKSGQMGIFIFYRPVGRNESRSFITWPARSATDFLPGHHTAPGTKCQVTAVYYYYCYTVHWTFAFFILFFGGEQLAQVEPPLHSRDSSLIILLFIEIISSNLSQGFLILFAGCW